MWWLTKALQFNDQRWWILWGRGWTLSPFSPLFLLPRLVCWTNQALQLLTSKQKPPRFPSIDSRTDHILDHNSLQHRRVANCSFFQPRKRSTRRRKTQKSGEVLLRPWWWLRPCHHLLLYKSRVRRLHQASCEYVLNNNSNYQIL